MRTTTTIAEKDLLSILRSSKAGLSAAKIADKLHASTPRVTERLHELRSAKRVHVVGKTKSTRWVFGPPPAPAKKPSAAKKRPARASA